MLPLMLCLINVCLGCVPPRDDGVFEGYLRKRTALLSNMEELGQLSVTCNKQHAHRICWGKKVRSGGVSLSVSKFAGAYPVDLRCRWAAVVEQAAQARRL